MNLIGPVVLSGVILFNVLNAIGCFRIAKNYASGVRWWLFGSAFCATVLRNGVMMIAYVIDPATRQYAVPVFSFVASLLFFLGIEEAYGRYKRGETFEREIERSMRDYRVVRCALKTIAEKGVCCPYIKTERCAACPAGVKEADSVDPKGPIGRL